ncbi:MAG TPA: glycosyltransferase family 4 protein [Syntrophales bacterium]|nr:glycosyltransferase family 4 protein [Syntrophales bacterium]HOX93958.1 glycosyltransferase family 4 protein [Syntrophales bacterium]HPI57399.1 glycosyltransferase family 4 protein [Syntrophales bacterium]HPN25463.1 glycosyltransferase family 4 protein [Syntrophales bacterium]HQM29945.1 glycosyltransferase family 4 protein [Syntrophales bacterium]
MNLELAGKILYISSVDISLNNGPGVNEREFCAALHDLLSERVHFLIPEPQLDNIELPQHACTFCHPHMRHDPKMFLRHTVSQIRHAEKLTRKKSFDLLVFRLDILPFAPWYITRKSGIPYVNRHLAKNLMSVLSSKGGLIGKSLEPLNRILIKKLVVSAALSDTVSYNQVVYLKNALKIDESKIICIDNTVNTSRFFPVPINEARKKLGIEKFDPIIGYVGNHPLLRGGEHLIRVAPKLMQKYPSLGVLILGDDGGLERLKKIAVDLKVETNCVLPGLVPYDQVPSYINSIDVGVSILQSKEFGASEQKVRQYLACGKPVVATPGSNEFIAEEQLGSLLNNDEFESIAHELDRWLSLDTHDRVKFSVRARDYAENHLSLKESVRNRLRYWSERLVAEVNK